ncbi:MAG: RNA polymerase sigma factor [Saprospiraceae bacterium]|nr:RNA polymerase sigma factor [Saprospiraceae bacterium]MCB9326620.1 RNA polymerase sigma factor [Lewinellaceae bacterium]
MSDEQILDMLVDQQLAERGFRLLMDKYQERLYWHVRRMVVSHENANDVVQNSFVKVFRSIGGFQRKSSLYTWLYRIATNEAITFLKKEKKNRTDSLGDESNSLENQLKADPYFEGDEIQLKLQCALDQLPEKQRLVFNMRYYEEMSYQNMSEVLDTSVGALKASYHHAAKKIESFLKKE